MSEKKAKENRREGQEEPEPVGPWVKVGMNQLTGMPTIDSNLTDWWRVTYMLTLALHAAADRDVQERVKDQKKVLLAPAMPGLKGMKS